MSATIGAVVDDILFILSCSIIGAVIGLFMVYLLPIFLYLNGDL